MYTLTVYKYVDAKTILQILQKETQDNVLWRKKRTWTNFGTISFQYPSQKTNNKSVHNRNDIKKLVCVKIVNNDKLVQLWFNLKTYY